MNKKQQPSQEAVPGPVASVETQEAGAGADSVEPVAAPVGIKGGRASLPQYRNIGPSLLTLDDGFPFQKASTAGLSPAEVQRFTTAGDVAGRRYIYPIAATEKAQGGDN